MAFPDNCRVRITQHPIGYNLVSCAPAPQVVAPQPIPPPVAPGGAGAQFSGFLRLYGNTASTVDGISTGGLPLGSIVIVAHEASSTELEYKLVAGTSPTGTGVSIWDVPPAVPSGKYWVLTRYTKDSRSLHYNATTTKFYKEEALGASDAETTTQIDTQNPITIPPT